MYLLILFVMAIALMILAMSRWKVHPFIAIMSTSLLLGLLVGIPLNDGVVDGVKVPGIVTVMGKGFSSIFTGIGIVIILGALIGLILEKTGAALKLADMIIRLVGSRRPVLSMELMGWVVSIPVFCDSGFVVLNPIRSALMRRTGASSVSMTVALAAGLFMSHVFIPPTPGPLACADALGLSDRLLLVMGLGVLCSVFPMIAGYCFALYVGGKVRADDEQATAAAGRESYDRLVASYGSLPGGWLSVAPILVPILLMSAASVVRLFDVPATVADVILFLSTPLMALTVGTLFAVYLLYRSGKGSLLSQLTGETLKTVGPILFITAAGGVLGSVIASSDMTNVITAHATLLQGLGLIFPFLLAALFKTSMGSSTVAIITTVGIVAPLLPALGYTSALQSALVCMAIGAGAMTVSHANDSYFWVVANFGAMTPERGYRTHTLCTLILGLTAMAEIMLLSLIF